MLRTFDGSTMTEVPSGSFSDNIDNPPPLALSAFAAHHSSLLPDPPRRRQRRSCDACRRGKRACDAEKCANFENQTCSNCLRKNQACTFNWLKTANESQQDRDRKRRRSSAQNSETSTDGSTIQSNASHHAAQVESTAKETRCAKGDQKTRWISSSDEEEEQEDGSNTTSADDADTEANGLVSFDELRSRKSSGRGLVPSSRSQKFPFGTRAYERSPDGEVPLQIKEMFLGERSSRGFVTNGLLRIYNDSMENALSCWLTEHNCPYTLQKYKPSILSAGKADKEWGSSWGNRMYNRVIQLDRAYNALRIRALTAEEERTVSKALKMAVVAFASQWAQAGERGTGFHTGDSNYTTDDFPESNYFERSMQESLWHQTSQILHRAAGIDSFRVVFAMIIFSLTQRPLDISRPFPHTTSKLKSQYEYFKNLIQDDDAPIFLEIALRQMLAQRRTLERAEQEMPKLPNGEPQDPLRPEDRDTFNLLYWLGVMFDTLSAAICQRTVVVNDEDCELPRSESQRLIQSPTLSIDPTVCDDPLMDDSTISANIGGMRSSQDHKVWGDLFMHDIESQADPQAARWPCSYKLAASTLSSAAPVKVLLYRRVAQLQALISRKASASKIEASINAAFHVYNHWNRNYNPFITDCVKHHATLPTRVQSWYILLAGHWHLGVFLLSDLLSTIDETRISLPNERACRQVSNLVTTLRKQNAYAVADLALASIHSAQGEVAEEFHFALNQAALLTEPWTIVFVRSLCRAGHILVQTAAMDPSEQERSQAVTRCADCIEGLWYLGRKSDMAFLAARCLSSMLDEARREAAALSSATTAMTTMTTATTTNTSEDEASDDILTAASCHFDDDSTPRDAVEPLDFPQPPSTTTTTTNTTTSTSTINTNNNINNANPTALVDCTSFFQPWSIADIMSGGGTGCQIAAAAAAAGTDQMPPLTDCDILDLQTPLGMDPSLWDFGLQS